MTISEENTWLLGKFTRMSVLCSRERVGGRIQPSDLVNQTLLAVDSRVILLETHTQSFAR